MSDCHSAPRILTVQNVDWPKATVVPLARSSAQERRRRAQSIISQAQAHDVVLLSGTVSLKQLYDQIWLAGYLARTGLARLVVLDGCHWEPGTRALNRVPPRISPPAAVDLPAARGATLAKSLVRWVNHPRIFYVVYGSDERLAFARQWGTPLRRVLSLNYHAHLWAGSVRSTPEPTCSYVFSGGNSLRDYRSLIASARHINAPIRIGTSLPMPEHLPANVSAASYSQTEFERLARRAAVHVVTSVANLPRSTGQATYLDALMLGIPVVVTDGLGVTDHLRNEVDALIVPAEDVDALVVAINRCLQDTELRRRLSKEGSQRALLEYTIDAFRSRQYDQICALWHSAESSDRL